MYIPANTISVLCAPGSYLRNKFIIVAKPVNPKNANYMNLSIVNFNEIS